MVLEASAIRVLTAIGLSATAIGTAVPYEGGFPAVMRRAATSLGLPCDPDAAPRKANAKDEGVDTLALLGWPDDPRIAGQWVFLGQATLARSSEWYRKLMEPKPDHWRSRLIQPMAPRRFLVVPHHVSSDYLAWPQTNNPY